MPEITEEEHAELEQLRQMKAELAERGELARAEELGDGDVDESGPATLTAAEVREFRRLQRESRERASKDREARKVAELKRSGPTHYVHLADGTVLKMSGGNIGTHHRVDDGTEEGHLVPVVSAHPMSEAQRERENDARLAALNA